METLKHKSFDVLIDVFINDASPENQKQFYDWKVSTVFQID